MAVGVVGAMLGIHKPGARRALWRVGLPAAAIPLVLPFRSPDPVDKALPSLRTPAGQYRAFYRKRCPTWWPAVLGLAAVGRRCGGTHARARRPFTSARGGVVIVVFSLLPQGPTLSSCCRAAWCSVCPRFAVLSTGPGLPDRQAVGIAWIGVSLWSAAQVRRARGHSAFANACICSSMPPATRSL